MPFLSSSTREHTIRLHLTENMSKIIKTKQYNMTTAKTLRKIKTSEHISILLYGFWGVSEGLAHCYYITRVRAKPVETLST